MRFLFTLGFPSASQHLIAHARAAGQHVQGRLRVATTFITISVNQGARIYSLLVIPDPLSEMRLSCGRGSSGRVLMDADNPSGRGSQHGRREGEGHCLLVHVGHSGTHCAFLVMHRASVR